MRSLKVLLLSFVLCHSTIAAVTQEEFHQVIDDVIDLYIEEAYSKGLTLVADRRWEDSTKNAYGSTVGTKYIVTLFGGLARESAMTQEAFAGVVCSEIGHILAGAPKGNFGYTNLNQSSYFVTAKCLRRYILEKNPRTMSHKAKKVTDDVKMACALAHKQEFYQKMCEQVSMSAFELAQVLNWKKVKLSFTTPDKTVVESTQKQYQSTQCRLDTYFAGALCDLSRHESQTTCSRDAGYQIGVRPLCWFKPE